MDHNTEYAAANLPAPASLEKCEVGEEGQRAALKNQRENVVMKQFPNVRYYQPLHTYLSILGLTAFSNIPSEGTRIIHRMPN